MTATRVPVAEGLFRLDDDGTLTLTGGFSLASGRSHFPRLTTCPYSGAGDVEAVDLPRQGTLWLWTAVTAPPPGYAGPVPYGFGVVELSDGLRVIGRLTEADPAALHEGQPMEVVPEVLGTDDDGNELVTWAFAPVAEDAEAAAAAEAVRVGILRREGGVR